MATLSENCNSQPDFPSDQAAILRDLARNGAADESNGYGYSDVGSNSHSNGAVPNSDFTFSDAYNNTGQSNSFQDIEDPAALLESLANFDHGPSSNDTPVPVSNDHFASLLQAAATAGGEVAAQTDRGRNRRTTRQSRSSEHIGFLQGVPADTRTKRKRYDYDDDEQLGFMQTSRSNKRQKQHVHEEDEEQLAREREIWGPEEIEGEDGSTTFKYQHSANATADARAVGVHSAAALFRRPSTASKKYTRPPMSKLFTSLELTPEQFLHLQAAAKNYMLDENYPERSDCVGNRGRGDTDMVKLKLFGCVKSFLEDEGWGDKCFGENAPGAESRKLKWPQMKNKVISLVTPLLRRMVTNERQRQYAIETRKNGPQKGSVAKSSNKGQSHQGSENPEGKTAHENGQLRQPSPSEYSELDPKLNQYHYSIDQSFASGDGQGVTQHQNSADTGADLEFQPETDHDSDIKYHVNILEDGKRVRPRLTLTPASCPGFPSLIQHIHSLMYGEVRTPKSIKVLAAKGLVDVSSDETWMEAVASIKANEWMDGEVKCIVQMEDER